MDDAFEKTADTRRANLVPTSFFSIPSSGTLYRNPSLSLRGAEGDAAISLYLMHYEIASVVTLPRNDITTFLGMSVIPQGF